VSAPASPNKAPPKTKNKMSLKKAPGGGNSALMAQLASEGEVMEDASAGHVGISEPAIQRNMVMREPIHVMIDEVCKLTFEADGTMGAMQVNGNVNLLVTNPDMAPCKLRVAHSAGSDFQFKCHPKLSKDAFFGSAEPWLTLAKDRAFPCDNPLGILKWRYNNSDEDKAPLKVTCWPSDQRGKTHVNMEYELGEVIQELQDIIITIPVPSSCEVIDVSGETSYDARNGNLLWKLDSVDASNNSGSLEFALPAVSHDSFFPIDVKFTAPQCYCNIEVLGIMSTETGQPVKFSKEVTLKVDEYTIGESQ